MLMKLRIALAGNPNSGKTTLFNALTGSNQFVGNWPGVTVEKKEGKLKKQYNPSDDEVEIDDLPGIYSLSPYTLEEVVSRNFLVKENPDAILNIVDGTNIERNLYLSTQLAELGIPMVLAVNMMDVVDRNGDKISVEKLSEHFGVKCVSISALKGDGIDEAVKETVSAAKKKVLPKNVVFDSKIETAIGNVSDKLSDVAESKKRFVAIKALEKDSKLDELTMAKTNAETEAKAIEDAFDDDVESVITNARYEYISSVISSCLVKKAKGKLSVSDKIDKIVTNRILALPIFAAVMWLVYFISVTTVGTWATDWANDGVFGDGWHLFGIGSAQYAEVSDEYNSNALIVDGFDAYVEENGAESAGDFEYAVEDEETLEVTYETATLDDYAKAKEYLEANEEPDPAAYGVWVPGVPVLVERVLDALKCNDVVKGLILDGIVAGVGAVLGFVPQILVLFIFLAFLESCGYMARVAFIMDRIFRKFGLSGKSFIPMLISSGCGIPGIMASRTIENDRDRKMTIMTTTFIPCGAKLPFIAMVAGAIFGGNPWIAPLSYFIGIAAVIISGIILKKTKVFSGDPAPFVMELPAYHWPTVGNVLRSMWERGWSFIKKAGTVILLSTIVIWFTTFFGFTEEGFRMLAEDEIDLSILAKIGGVLAPIFIPLGWGEWEATVAAITGLVAKENIVGTLGIIYGASGDVWSTMHAAFTPTVAGLSFLTFNLLCAPCFAAMGAIKREMNNAKWFWIAVGYQTLFAYAVSLCIFQIGRIFATGFTFGSAIGILFVAGFVFLLVRKNPYVKKKA